MAFWILIMEMLPISNSFFRQSNKVKSNHSKNKSHLLLLKKEAVYSIIEFMKNRSNNHQLQKIRDKGYFSIFFDLPKLKILLQS
jgi:hypothetical protein